MLGVAHEKYGDRREAAWAEAHWLDDLYGEEILAEAEALRLTARVMTTLARDPLYLGELLFEDIPLSEYFDKVGARIRELCDQEKKLGELS